MLIFVDDINMPRVDKYANSGFDFLLTCIGSQRLLLRRYGTQQPIALLKLLIEREGLFNKKDLDWMRVRDIQTLGAMCPAGGARNNLDPRFVSLFSVFCVVFPPKEALELIYGTILSSKLVGFSNAVSELAGVITESTLALYAAAAQQLPPTPSKFHYIFNLRDLSRVFEGLCLATPDRCETPSQFVRLWRHECLRVFHDRLLSDADKRVVNASIERLVRSNFGQHTGLIETVLAEPIVFGDFQHIQKNDDGEEAVRLYEDLLDYERIKPIFEQQLEVYNASQKAGKELQLVMFEDALEHLARIHRVLRLARGNLLLVGPGGSGKRSLTQLGSFVAGCSMFEIVLTR
jgi:dynein heavy chain